MANPWDRPPLSKRGNRSDRTLFAAIGRALIGWEEIEASMAHLYAAFTAADRFSLQEIRDYGKPANFKDRMAILQTSADNHFRSCPSQEIEGEFCRLKKLIDGYTGRRNDIAHSRVLYIQMVVEAESLDHLKSMVDNLQWCLVPPFFRANKFTANNRPAYILTSWEINEFARVFWDIARALSNLSLWVLSQRSHASHGIRLQPGALPYKVRVPRIRKY